MKTRTQVELAVRRLRHPKRGSAVAAARDFGIDLTLLIEQLQRSPDERVRRLQEAMQAIEHIRGAAGPATDP